LIAHNSTDVYVAPIQHPSAPEITAVTSGRTVCPLCDALGPGVVSGKLMAMQASVLLLQMTTTIEEVIGAEDRGR
jgi:hypothetical protein